MVRPRQLFFWLLPENQNKHLRLEFPQCLLPLPVPIDSYSAVPGVGQAERFWLVPPGLI